MVVRAHKRCGMRMQNNPFAGIEIGRAIIGINTISGTGKRHTPAMLGEGDIVGIGATEQKTIYAFTKTVEEFEPFRRCLTHHRYEYQCQQHYVFAYLHVFLKNPCKGTTFFAFMQIFFNYSILCGLMNPAGSSCVSFSTPCTAKCI